MLVAIGSAWTVPRASVAQDEVCGGEVGIVNGGFESPAVPDYTAAPFVPTSWTGSGSVAVIGPTHDNSSQSVQLADPDDPGSISQALSQPDLLGSTVTLTIRARSSGTVTFNGETQPFAGPGTAWIVSTVTFDIPASAALPLTLVLADQAGGTIGVVDSISGVYAKPCPTPTPTDTPIPTNTPTPTPTMTPSPTPSPTSIPSPTPSPTTSPGPTATTSLEPIPDQQLTITGDPRFPITGSAAIPGEPGLTYTLGTPPALGTVSVLPDGSFTYTAASSLATGDEFTVIATAAGGVTATVNVTVVYEVDKSVPTYGEVEPGGTGYGGPVEDARNPVSPPSPSPTLVPDDEGDDEDSCDRCD
jgi:hypothetical protein